MASLSFLWHLHQPAYRTADGVSHAPWVALHAGGTYTTLATAISETGGRGQILNVVPTLLEQLLAYRDGAVDDPVIEILVRPAADLDDTAQTTLIQWSRHVSPRQVERSPRLGELIELTSAAGAGGGPRPTFDRQHLRDLQVLTILANACDQAWRDERLEALAVKGRDFDRADHLAAVDWLRSQPGELIELWRHIDGLPGVEFATSPYAHPIMPLLIDSNVVHDSWAPAPAPTVPDFSYSDDARHQLDRGIAYMRRNGFEPRGCWPPEGAISAAAAAVYSEAGVSWLVTDEGILEKSLGESLRSGDHADPRLYRPWRLKTPSPTIFFRDRTLSDQIGFVLGRWHDESAAAADLMNHLLTLARTLPDEATITIALDGENPWPHYPACGGVFLRELLDRLNDAGHELEPATLADATNGSTPEVLPRLHPGSWINSTFATWIGHPEKTAAWELLAAVRSRVENGSRLPESILLAEGSDWFWWLGDDNPTELAPLYDEIFRRHLQDACDQAGIEPPVDLSRPLKSD